VAVTTKPHDDAVLRAALEVYRALELPAQLDAFGRIAAEWSGGDAFVALGRDEDAGGFAPLAATLPSDDARLLALRAVGRAREVPLPAACERWERVGPVGDLPGGPRASLAVPLRDAKGEAVALLLVFEPTADAGSRLDALAGAVREAFANSARSGSSRSATTRPSASTAATSRSSSSRSSRARTASRRRCR
jgi:hypothetical protein